MRAVLTALCGLLLSGAAPTQAVTIYGIRVGEPLDLPECAAEYADVMCFGRVQTPIGPNATLGPAMFPAGVMPKILKTREVDLLVIDGVVHALTLHTTGISGQAEALKLLGEKFGKPGSLETKTMQNGFGATFEVVEAAWRIGSVQLDLIGGDGRSDEGRITAYTPKAASYWISHKPQEPKL